LRDMNNTGPLAIESFKMVNPEFLAAD
jgi:hypothetical protein